MGFMVSWSILGFSPDRHERIALVGRLAQSDVLSFEIMVGRANLRTSFHFPNDSYEDINQTKKE